MKTGKRIVLLLLAVMLLLCAAGCKAIDDFKASSIGSKFLKEVETELNNSANGSGSTDMILEPEVKKIKDIYIGVSLGTIKQERWMREADMFQRCADVNNFKLTILSANDDEALQQRQCEHLIEDGIDVLILQTLSSDSVQPIVEKAHQAGVEVIGYDRLAPNSELDYCVTFDSVKVGESQANMLVDKIPKGNYLWLKGGQEDYNAALVAKGQKKVLQQYIDAGDITIVGEEWCAGWNPVLAQQITEQALMDTDGKLDAVIASNDGLCGGAVQALAANGMAGKVVTCGQDASLAACQRIVEGTQLGTVFKPIADLNKAACQLAVALASGSVTENAEKTDCVDKTLGKWTSIDSKQNDVPVFMIDVYPVDKHNIYDVIIDEYHFQTMEEVYVNIDQSKWPKTK